LRNWGGESLREDAKNCFYPVIIENEQIIGFGDVLDESEHPESQTVLHGEKYYVYPIDINGVERKWRYARQSVDGIKHLLRVRRKQDGKGFEVEIGKDFGIYRTVWVDPRYDANEYGTKIVKSLVPNCNFDFPKSLYNVYDCIYSVIGKDKNAIVLDFFAGSGTTAHAVLELNKKDDGNRQFILCEQLDYVKCVTVERVKNVIKSNGHGSFNYFELLQWNESFIRQIEQSQNLEALWDIWQKIQSKAHLSYKVDPKTINANASEFKDLSLQDQKRFLLEVLDKNALYVNYSEIDDAEYAVTEEDKRLNHQFYKGEA